MLFTDNEQVAENVYSVSELTKEIKILLESTIPIIWITGEISNFKLHSSGHMYFSLKDQDSQIPCVMWRGRNSALRFTPENGIKVIAQGKVTVYEKRGAYQLDIVKMQPAGIGELQLAFEQLKQRLQEEGLFNEDHKQQLPAYPERIGIVTSPTGAAIQDLLNVLSRRFPGVEIIINPVKVQGEGAAGEIAKAIDEFNEFGEIDLMIVGRGGGSLEDLWAFNEEIVARAIFKSVIPIISAVGHEVDFSISDFVADVRAPTPSAAAELAVPDRQELLDKIRQLLKSSYTTIYRNIELNQEKLQNILNSYNFRRTPDIIRQYQQRLDELTRFIENNQKHRMELFRKKLDSLTQNLNALAPTSVLKRGYSICYRVADDSIVTNAGQFSKSDKIKVRFFKGKITGTVDKVYE